MTEQKSIVEVIDVIIELASNSKEVQISLSKEDFEQVRKDLDSEAGEGFSWGEFKDIKPETTEGVFSVVRQNVRVYFMQR